MNETINEGLLQINFQQKPFYAHYRSFDKRIKTFDYLIKNCVIDKSLAQKLCYAGYFSVRQSNAIKCFWCALVADVTEDLWKIVNKHGEKNKNCAFQVEMCTRPEIERQISNKSKGTINSESASQVTPNDESDFAPSINLHSGELGNHHLLFKTAASQNSSETLEIDLRNSPINESDDNISPLNTTMRNPSPYNHYSTKPLSRSPSFNSSTSNRSRLKEANLLPPDFRTSHDNSDLQNSSGPLKNVLSNSEVNEIDENISLLKPTARSGNQDRLPTKLLKRASSFRQLSSNSHLSQDRTTNKIQLPDSPSSKVLSYLPKNIEQDINLHSGELGKHHLLFKTPARKNFSGSLENVLWDSPIIESDDNISLLNTIGKMGNPSPYDHYSTKPLSRSSSFNSLASYRLRLKEANPLPRDFRTSQDNSDLQNSSGPLKNVLSNSEVNEIDENISLLKPMVRSGNQDRLPTTLLKRASSFRQLPHNSHFSQDRTTNKIQLPDSPSSKVLSYQPKNIEQDINLHSGELGIPNTLDRSKHETFGPFDKAFSFLLNEPDENITPPNSIENITSSELRHSARALNDENEPKVFNPHDQQEDTRRGGLVVPNSQSSESNSLFNKSQKSTVENYQQKDNFQYQEDHSKLFSNPTALSQNAPLINVISDVGHSSTSPNHSSSSRKLPQDINIQGTTQARQVQDTRRYALHFEQPKPPNATSLIEISEKPSPVLGNTRITTKSAESIPSANQPDISNIRAFWETKAAKKNDPEIIDKIPNLNKKKLNFSNSKKKF